MRSFAWRSLLTTTGAGLLCSYLLAGIAYFLMFSRMLVTSH